MVETSRVWSWASFSELATAADPNRKLISTVLFSGREPLTGRHVALQATMGRREALGLIARRPFEELLCKQPSPAD
jgi:hypothetical protein